MPFIVLDGEIAPGDLEKLKEQAAVLYQNRYPLVIQLNSQGGDLNEALEIAEFVRASWATTWLRGLQIFPEDANKLIVTCDSACAIIFLAGIHRRYSEENTIRYLADDPYVIPFKNRRDAGGLGEAADIIREAAGLPKIKMETIPVLGLHRPYIIQDYNSQLTGAASAQLYIQMEKTVQQRMLSYSVPEALIDRMMRTSSTNIDRIDPYELREILPKTEPWFEEWQLATCGTMSNEESYDLSSARWERYSKQKGWSNEANRYSDGYLEYLTAKKKSLDDCRLGKLLEHQGQHAQSP